MHQVMEGLKGNSVRKMRLKSGTMAVNNNSNNNNNKHCSLKDAVGNMDPSSVQRAQLPQPLRRRDHVIAFIQIMPRLICTGAAGAAGSAGTVPLRPSGLEAAAAPPNESSRGGLRQSHGTVSCSAIRTLPSSPQWVSGAADAARSAQRGQCVRGHRGPAAGAWSEV